MLMAESEKEAPVKKGRPEKVFTEKEVKKVKALARCHCPDSEIAAFLDVGETTLKRHFGPLLHEAREVGKANIRSKQYKLAMKGNIALLIWLGKQILGQRDKQELTGRDGEPLNPLSKFSPVQLKKAYEEVDRLIKGEECSKILPAGSEVLLPESQVDSSHQSLPSEPLERKLPD